MTSGRRALAGIAALILGGLALTGCGAVRDILAEVPLDVPTTLPSLPAQAAPFEKIYQGGERPEGITDEEWETKSQRRITAAGALNGVLVFGVDHQAPSTLTVKIKGDPEDTALIATVEGTVVPVALSWGTTVTVIIDPSLCAVAGEVRDDTPLCDALSNR